MISEKDRPILGYLTNIELDLHSGEKGEGFDLIFTFSANSYFEETVIRKEIIMTQKGLPEKTKSTKINWKDACNPTLTKKKKKKKGKKVTVEVKCDSFFNIFNDIDPETFESSGDKEDDEEGQDMEDELDQKLQDDMDTAE